MFSPKNIFWGKKKFKDPVHFQVLFKEICDILRTGVKFKYRAKILVLFKAVQSLKTVIVSTK